ncbi:MAG: desulfoferrodoxin FeS4 iron-binding domain-containing protein [Eubacterium sp.]|nr:desulfoferrodoxin FeS4 iron-binding domain-containing protein [Eubacterium sp.]
MKVLKCMTCGNIVTVLNEGGGTITCCGSAMTELVPNTSDGAGEKHVPVVTVDGAKVSVAVGSVEHPMLDAHYIQWIALETDKGVQFKNLKPGEKPVAEFVLADGEKAVAAYEYCNLHGLWKTDI